jgi:protein-tyrosine-phosphatase
LSMAQPLRDTLRTIARPLARALRAIGKVVDRALHPLRRRRALRRLAGWPTPASVVVVCYGNICRSPFAARLLHHRLEASSPEIRVESVGFFGEDRPSPPEAVMVAVELGVDLAEHRSRVLCRADMEETDLIVVVDPAHGRRLRRMFGCGDKVLVLGDLDPDGIETRVVLDPDGKPVEVFREVYARIDRCTTVLTDALASGAG